MSSWNIIGWMILTGLGSLVAFLLGRYFARWGFTLWYHLRTRNIAPAPGQIWVQGYGDPIHINRITGDGVIVIYSYASNMSRISWGENLDEWRQRVRNRKLWLLKIEAGNVQ